MFDAIKQSVLGLLKVPPMPDPPAGSPDSVRVFRAGPNFYKLLLLKWGFAQASAVLGIVVGLAVWHSVEDHVPPPARAGVYLLELLGVAGYALQLPFTYAALRLDYELRWYIVTDRSLRIRWGIWTMREMTLTFANIQQITIAQGPLQRLLGIADLKVTTAGGGRASAPAAQHGRGADQESMHVGYFRGVANAAEIRDLILERLRRFRDAGLGDPDEPAPPPAAATSGLAECVAAANELLAEARQLRLCWTRAPRRHLAGGR